ncbi:MAG: P-II family nitrogen regulator [Planctomycetota bacterium]|jgi:nitrogen regulatory protein PII
MRHFTVYLKPFRLDAVIESVLPFGPKALAVEEVRGYGRQKGHLELYRGSEYDITFLPKIKLTFAAPAGKEREVIEALSASARTGRIGDGKVLVREVRRIEAI